MMRPGMKRVSPIRQVHVRVSAAMKKAVKMFCVREAPPNKLGFIG